jgi:Holliday junction resolvase RusA-like endonuclease
VSLAETHDRPFGVPLTRHVVVELAGTPVAKGRPKFGNGHAYTPRRTRNFETDLAWAAKVAMHGHPPIEGALKVEVLAAFPVPASWSKIKQARALAGILRPTGRPDIDNVLKAADALNGIVWRDDAQIVTAQITKRYSDNPRLRIEVEALFTGGA